MQLWPVMDCAALIIRILRRVLELVFTLGCFLLCGSKRHALPPISQPLLLSSASRLAARIRSRKLKSEELVRAYIKRIREVQPAINAVVDERFRDAIEEARGVDSYLLTCKKSPQELYHEKPFLGVPITVKNSFSVKGMVWDVGMPARKGLKADEDAETVKQMKEAGAIVLAMTNVPEMCFWWNCNNIIYGRTNNPYDLTRTPGGSSGGEAALIASAGSVMGLGNDIGGSLRFPSSFCGIYAHKSSRGLTSLKGMYPVPVNELADYAISGPLCRYVEDLRPAMKILTLDNQIRSKFDKKLDLRHLKIYYVDELHASYLTPVSPDIKRAMKKCLVHFERTHGVKGQRASIPVLEHSFFIWLAMMRIIDAPTFAELMADQKGKANVYMEIFRWLIGRPRHTLQILTFGLLEKLVPAKKSFLYDRYKDLYAQLKQRFEKLLTEDNDAILIMPSFTESAPYHQESFIKGLNCTYASIFNLLGLPVTNCPMGFDSKGLPIGVQIVAAHNNDCLTISVAEEMEKIFGGWSSPTIIL